jgi:hypothetical protein
LEKGNTRRGYQLLAKWKILELEFCETTNEVPKLEPIEQNEYSGRISLRYQSKLMLKQRKLPKNKALV